MMAKLLLSAALLLGLSGAVADAADAHFGETAFSTENGRTAQDTFTPDIGKILLHVELIDAEKGQKVTAAWIAERTEVAPANYKIDASTVTLAAKDADEVTFSLSRPNNGWPVGLYRVDLDIDGAATRSAHFTVAK